MTTMAAAETTSHKFAGILSEPLIREIKARRCATDARFDEGTGLATS